MRLLLILFVGIFFNNLFGQSAVYFCPETGIVGFAYNAPSKAAAEQQALDYCVKYGGKHPRLVVSTEKKGFGAIALGENAQGKTIIGVGLAYPAMYLAQDNARQECINAGGNKVYIFAAWDDREKKENPGK